MTLSEIGWSILLGVVAGLVTTVLQIGWAHWLSRRMARQTWRFRDPSTLTVSMSITDVVDATDVGQESAHLRKGVGPGPIRALATVTPLLVRAYPSIDISDIPMDAQDLNLSGDILVLGGVKRNLGAREVLAKIGEGVGMEPADDGDAIVLTQPDGTQLRLTRRLDKSGVLTDFALVLRDRNPDGSSSQWLVLAGCSAWGTVAAAKWITEKGSTYFSGDGRRIRRNGRLQTILQVVIRHNRIVSVSELLQ